MSDNGNNENRVSTLVDCDNSAPEILEYAHCLVTSDSDFAYLCRKLRERGATVCIVGEEKTPDALRNASDKFFEYQPPKTETQKKTPPKPQ